ncbi:Mercuric transport protein, MerC [hydrothermal vent metagenome]|uniref:Mercuric transport protein, MerC n=1 Tax=hydrothermal vent metagenome TaxID=652676 RepID=A0A3B0YH51_9ZZZZ
MRFTSFFDASGSIGAVVSAMGCASCFPAIAALGSSVGLGFLGHFEGIFINTLLPVFAGIALAANILAFVSHRIWYRLLAGITGPLMVLATLYLFWTDDWSTYMFYAGLAIMMGVSIWDIVSPARKVCSSGAVLNERSTI